MIYFNTFEELVEIKNQKEYSQEITLKQLTNLYQA